MKAKKHLIISLVILSILAGTQVVAQSSQVPGQAIMKMTIGGKPDDVLRGKGANVDDSIPGHQTYLLEITSPEDWDAAIAEVSDDSAVIFVEPNYSVELPENYQMSISFPDDNTPPLLDGVEPIEFFDQEALYDIGIDPNQSTYTGTGIILAVIDNGVAFDHPLLTSRLLGTGYDFIDNDGHPSYEPGAVAGHGTFVSGLVALTAPDCMILPLRAFDGDGMGNTYAIADAIYHAISNGAQVINMSFGTHENSRILIQACNAAIAAGASMVAASGNNSSSDPTYPAAMPGVIAVSGIDTQDELASFSNYGDFIDICAPAVNLYSSLAGEDEWGTWSGTSFAAPFVSATCALILQAEPDFSTFIMESHIRDAASLDFLWGTLIPPDPAYGYGRLDIGNSISLARSEETLELYGDLDGSGESNAGDVVFLIRHVYNGGPSPTPPGNPDINCDGVVDGFDIEYYINRVFRRGPRPGGCH